jgi:hypothetical protein
MKNLFSAIVLTAGLAGVATTAQAQTTFSIGPRLGLNMATVATSGPDTRDVDAKNTFGAQVGVTANVGFGEHFAFQPSVLFAQKGFKTSESGTESFNGVTITYSGNTKTAVNYLEVPLNFVYTTGGDQGFQVFAGPYLALGVGGKSTYDYTVKDNTGQFNTNDSGSYVIKFADKEEANNNGNSNVNYVRRFDAGVNLGLGYRQGPVQVQLGYGFGFGNLVPLESDGNDSGNKAQNRVLQLSANYFFSAK